MTRIVIFAKAPVAGKAKTRLIPALGEEGAAELAHRMLLDTFKEASRARTADVELCLAPDPAHGDWNGRIPAGAERLTAQEGDDLGHRLAAAAERVIGEGSAVIFIGTDCPALTQRRLREACRELESHEAVIHPTMDGGYALLGLRRFDPSVFENIAWSTGTVARETMKRLRALGWTVHLGETLQDIDEPEDLAALPSRLSTD